jgi:xylulokinase
MEGICFETRMILDTMRETFSFHFDGVNAIGGGTQNSLWQQIKADILGMSVDVPDVVESASKGAALLAGIGVGAYRDLIDASRKTYRLKRRFDPEASLVDQYSDLYAVYKRIYPALRETNMSLDTRFA